MNKPINDKPTPKVAGELATDELQQILAQIAVQSPEQQGRVDRCNDLIAKVRMALHDLEMENREMDFVVRTW